MRSLLLVFIILFVSCNSKMIKNSETKISLNEKEFKDEMIFQNSAMLGISRSYFFKNDTYYIELTHATGGKYPKYIVEKGEYILNGFELYIKPICKLSYELLDFWILCHGNYDEGILICKDTTNKNIENLKFENRIVKLQYYEGGLSFLDSSFFLGKFTEINKIK